jgi:hypothetical protein
MLPYGGGLSSAPVSSSWVYPYGIRNGNFFDYERGGKALNDASLGLDLQIWIARYDPAGQNIWVQSDGGTPTTVLSGLTGVERISLTFDQLMNPTICYVQQGVTKLYFYDGAIQSMATATFPNAVYGIARLDDRRIAFSGQSDIILTTIENGFVGYRLQRDRYLTFYPLEQTQERIIRQAGMNRNWRFQIQLGSESAIVLTGADGVSAAAVVADLCERVGAPYDADAIVGDMMDGFIVNQQTAARSYIESMMAAHFFDGYEDSGVITFRKQSSVAAATYDESELAVIVGSEAKADTLRIKRAQEHEIAKTVNIGYFDVDREFEPSIQTAARYTSANQSETTLNLPMVLGAQKAAQIADRVLRNAWLHRETVSFALPITEIGLRPTDRVILMADGVSNLIKITSINYQLAGVLSCEGVIESLDGLTDAANYVDYQSPAAGASGVFVPSDPTPAPTPLIGYWLDLPLLKDFQPPNGVYVAAGTTGRFSGGALYLSQDGGIDYFAVADLPEAITGVTLTRPEVPSHPFIVDRASVLRVQLDKASNQLSSITTLSALTRNQNVALVGQEIIVFESASFIEPGIYELSGLHRGLRGTDHALATHTDTERFVLLSGAAQRVELENTYLGLSAGAKFVQDRASLDEVTAQIVRYDGIAYKPYSVAHLVAQNTGAGQWALSWLRRSRLDGEWRDGVDVPLAEQTELYEVEVFGGVNLIDEFQVNAPSAVVTAQAGNTVRVYQISNVVGRGWPSDITLT